MLGRCVRKFLSLRGLSFFWILLFTNINVASTELPYWKQDPNLFHQINFNRKIAVKVQSSENYKKWDFYGGGHIQCDLVTSWKVAHQFEKLSELSWLFKKVLYDSSKQRLHIQIKFMGFERSLSVQISELKVSNEWKLNFQIYQGFFQGLEGTLDFFAYRQSLTEVDLRAEYLGPIRGPIWAFVNAAEFAMYYVATRLRDIIEKNPC